MGEAGARRVVVDLRTAVVVHILYEDTPLGGETGFQQSGHPVAIHLFGTLRMRRIEILKLGPQREFRRKLIGHVRNENILADDVFPTVHRILLQRHEKNRAQFAVPTLIDVEREIPVVEIGSGFTHRPVDGIIAGIIRMDLQSALATDGRTAPERVKRVDLTADLSVLLGTVRIQSGQHIGMLRTQGRNVIDRIARQEAQTAASAVGPVKLALHVVQAAELRHHSIIAAGVTDFEQLCVTALEHLFTGHIVQIDILAFAYILEFGRQSPVLVIDTPRITDYVLRKVEIIIVPILGVPRRQVLEMPVDDAALERKPVIQQADGIRKRE